MPVKKSCIITGATGFIGRKLSHFLIERGFEVLGLSRNPDGVPDRSGLRIPLARWNPDRLDGWETVMKNAAIVISLAGESIGRFRWTRGIKQRILQSRVRSCRCLVRAFEETGVRPEVFIQNSGIGYYGSRKDEILDEDSSPGKGFLAQVSREWEAATEPLKEMNIRRVVFRTGMVLGKEGGALKRLTLPFHFFLGSRFGSGKQWVPWVHIGDVCRTMEYIIIKSRLEGIFNLTAPKPVTNREMTRTIGKILKKPSFFIVPSFLIQILLGEMGRELLLPSQRVAPRRLLEEGYEFCYTDLKAALSDILS